MNAADQRLAQAAHRARIWTDRRNGEIELARDRGKSLRAIADLTGLSHTAIAKILAK